MNKTVKTILLLGTLTAVIAIAVAIKVIWFPTIKDIWFQGRGQQLKLAPAGLVILRPTHFPHSAANTFLNANVNGKQRVAARNMTFQRLIAIAYEYNQGHISLPDGTPTNGFDILITAPGDYHQKLKDLILRKTGYTADVETQDADVLALKVVDPHPAYMTPSAPDEKDGGGGVTNGRLYLMHVKFGDIAKGLDNFMKTPVVDETGLSNNYYDFSLKWSRGMNPNNFSRDEFDKIVADWGLAFEPDTAPMEMLVVKKKY